MRGRLARFNAALVNADTAALRAMFAPGFVSYSDPSKPPVSATQLVASLTRGTRFDSAAVVGDARIVWLDSARTVAHVIWHQRIVGTVNGSKLPLNDVLLNESWTWRRGSWRMQSRHAQAWPIRRPSSR